jgi:outer membrane protein TolC
MKIVSTLVLGLFLFCLDQANAQNALSLKDAFDIALQNNFSIQIAANDFEVTKKNNVIGNAGMLPSINGVVNQDNQVLDSKQKFLNGTENNRNGAKINQLNAGVELNWTLFNGMKMFATKSKLAELEAIGEVRLRQQMETLLTRVAKAYFDILLLREQLKSGKEFIEISEKRLEIAKAKVLAGKSAKPEVLNAQVNLNTDLAGYKRLETQYKNSKLGLNLLMGKDLSFTFEATDSLMPKDALSIESIKELAAKNNSGIQSAKLNREVAQFQLKEIKGERYPSLQLKSGYSYNQQQSQAGFLQSANTNGFHYGLGLNLTVFNGFDIDRRIGNSKIAFKNSDLLLKDSLLKLEVAVTQAYNVYLNNIDLYAFEKTNLDVAKQNFELSRDQYDQGMISSNDLRIAQTNYLLNVNRLLVAAYDSKLSEMELERLSGSLIK